MFHLKVNECVNTSISIIAEKQASEYFSVGIPPCCFVHNKNVFIRFNTFVSF